MARPAVFLLIAAIGLPLANQTSAAAMDALVNLTGIQNVNQWVDPESNLMVELTPGKCLVSDILAVLTKAEQDRFDAAIPLAIQSALPNLTEAKVDGMQGWSVFRIWADTSSPLGVSLSRLGSTIKGAETEVSISLPRR